MNAKAEAESLAIEIELKNKMLSELRADLNRSKKKIEDLQAQNDQLECQVESFLINLNIRPKLKILRFKENHLKTFLPNFWD